MTTTQPRQVNPWAAMGALSIGLTVSMHAAAVTSAAGLPAGYRAPFVDSIARAAGSATSGGASGCTLPPGVPASLANRLCALGTSTFQHGFTEATRTTLILPTAVLALGALACLAIARRQHRPGRGHPSQAPVAVAESV